MAIMVSRRGLDLQPQQLSTRSLDEKFMLEAIAEAGLGDRTPGAGEVGCVIVRDGEVIARGHNEAHLSHDPTAHAEIVTLRRLGQKLKRIDFSGFTLYVTLQPCSMCAAACVWARISRIVYGARRSDVHAMYFDARHINAAQLIADAYQEDLEIRGGVLAKECAVFYYKPDDTPPVADQENR
ncbi:MAG TPA: nucleoside deaminase [Bryobacteraceae bacterium]|jgi:tRNA(adenine34) deaminase|nr:nucleoside deaminase [Bryobacteraceae bacterium]